MSHPKMSSFNLAGIILAIFVSSLYASGQVLRGTVVDGTAKKPAGGDDVILIKIDRGMSEEKRTKSNAHGEFSFELPESQTMRAVRVVHDKVSYYQPVPPGSTSVAVTVYKSEPTVPGIHRTDQSVIFQSQNGTLQMVELFNIRNDSNPPVTQPTFGFYLPDGAQLQGGEAMRENAMPLKSAPVPQEEKGKYLFMYPLIPGTTHFEVVYTLPYTGTLKFQPKFAGPVEKFYVVTPKSIGFSPESSQYQTTQDTPIGPGFKDIDVHVVNAPLGHESQLAFSVAGNGMLQEDTSQQAAAGGGGQAAPAGGQSAGARPGEPEGPGGGMGIPNERPNPLSQGQWAFLGILTVFLAGGAGIVIMMSSGSAEPAPATPRKGQTPVPLLDALKEEMFQLETDRLHGKLNPEEYKVAKGVLDKTLHRTMKKK